MSLGAGLVGNQKRWVEDKSWQKYTIYAPAKSTHPFWGKNWAQRANPAYLEADLAIG
jgi:hypothetical protein